jgi:hypothetical protein
MTTVGDQTSMVVETFVRLWLTKTDAGQRMLAHLDLEIESAIDSVFELLNAGFLKLETDGTAFTGLQLCLPPSPPNETIQRVRRA